jgi:hypothetical protein
MKSIDDLSEKDEPVLYRARRHWAMLLGPALLMIFGGLSVPTKGMPAVILLAAGTLWAIIASICLQTSEFGLTEKRLIIKVGMPWLRPYDIPLAGIEGFDYYQPALGRLLDFGKIILKPVGAKKKSFAWVRGPMQFRENVLDRIRIARNPEPLD